MTKKDYFIFIDKEKVMVSKEVYLAYWKQTNREKYLELLDRKNRLLYISQFDQDGNFQDIIEDKSVDVEKLVETKEAIVNLRKAISKLSDEEREIINALYFREETIRDVAQNIGTHKTSLIRKRDRILEKLKMILEKNK